MPAQSPAKIQVIARAASVLRALEGEPQGLSIARIAERVGLARSTVQRIVASLSAEQLLIATGSGEGVRLGPLLLRLGTSATPDLGALLRPFVQELGRELGETVDVSVLRGRYAVFVDQVPGSQRLRAVSAVGERFPLHCTANGKALLSVLPKERAAELVAGELEAHTLHTLTQARRVLTQVARARRTGLAFDHEEHTEGISAVGTALLDTLGRPVAISLPVPSARYGRRADELGARLLATRARIAAALAPADARA